MLTLFRWFFYIAVGLFATILIGMAGIWYFAARSLPNYDRTTTLAGLSAPVEIIRSTDNVPHIMAENDLDAFLALGYVHAEDRLFQLTVLRRAAQGRLAEIYGPRAILSDDLLRRLMLVERSRDSFATLDPATQDALQAYADGINRRIEDLNREASGRGAPEFFLYPDRITYWRPEDSIAILKLWAFASTNALRDEVDMARLSLALPGQGPQIMAHPGDRPLGDYAGLFPDQRFATPQATPYDVWPDRLLGFLAPGSTAGGGVWAAAPDQTAAGGAILANDLQTALTVPGLYYLARLELRTGGVIGVTIPGVPAVLSGRNPQLAWGMAPSGVDDQDLFIEALRPGTPDDYRTPQGWKAFERATSTIRVLDDEPRRMILRESENGPILPSAHFGISDILPAGHVAALSWPGLARDDTSIAGLIGLMRAADGVAGLKAAKKIISPSFRLMLADQDGIYAMQTGRLPVRGANDGRLPMPGWLPEFRWQGMRVATPSTQPVIPGLQATASRPGAGGSRPQRMRLAHLTNAREVHSRESLIEEQLDIVSGAARQLLPVVGADLWFTGEPAAPGTAERQRQDALALLAAWDGRMNEHLPEPLIYATWMAELQSRLIRDELGTLADHFTSLYPDFIEAVYRNSDGAAAWCDVVQSAATEDCTTIARQALDAAILTLTERFGPEVSSWRWGDAHQAVHIHPALGMRPFLGWFANLRQSLSGGDFTLAQAGLLNDGRTPWQAVQAAGYRGIYDLSDPDSSVFIISTGQSGHLLSRHYEDLGELWRRGEYIRMSLDPDLARGGGAGITWLMPDEDHRPDDAEGD